jgi:hypothetical protein
VTLSRLAALAAVLAACGKPCPPPSTPAIPDDMHLRDDASPPPALHMIELTLATDAAIDGHVHLRVVSHGNRAVKIALPARADQVEWFDPRVKMKAPAPPRVVWTAWRADNDGIAEGSRASAGLESSKIVVLERGAVHDVVADIRDALDGMLGPDTFARGWCVRAWLIGGEHPVPSNVVCWPKSRPGVRSR